MGDAQGGDAALTSAVKRAGWRILPLLGLAYLIAYIDRVNISFAATQMNADLGFSATVYGLGGGLFFLAYSLFEIPSNLLLLRFGARRWIARIMITWGLLAAAMMFVQTAWQFYLLRFAIGIAEAGFFPGAVFYLTSWFPNARRARALSLFYLFGPLASVILGVVSAQLLALDGAHGLRGWQWLFLIEGLPAVGLGLLVLWRLPDSPADAGWLRAAERSALEGALAEDRRRAGAPPSHNVLEVLRNPLVQMMAVMGLLTISAFITFTLSAPLILIAATGWTAAEVGLVVSIGGLVAAVTMALAGWFMDHRGDRFLALFPAFVLQVAALLVIALNPADLAVMLAYVAFVAASWTSALAQMTIWSDALKERQLAIGAAAINTVAQFGAFLFPFAFGASRDATGSYTPGLLVLPALIGLALVLAVILRRRLGAAVR